jgi:hypothetical protein
VISTIILDKDSLKHFLSIEDFIDNEDKVSLYILDSKYVSEIAGLLKKAKKNYLYHVLENSEKSTVEKELKFLNSTETKILNFTRTDYNFKTLTYNGVIMKLN